MRERVALMRQQGFQGGPVKGGPERAAALRSVGAALTVVIGPASAMFGLMVLGMGALETVALLVLVSGWLGPKLMRAGGV